MKPTHTHVRAMCVQREIYCIMLKLVVNIITSELNGFGVSLKCWTLGDNQANLLSRQ
jgi:hypothetical protein